MPTRHLVLKRRRRRRDDDHHHHHPDDDDVCEKEEEEFVVVSVVSGIEDDDDDALRLSLDRIVERFSRAGRRRGEATRRTGAGDGTSSVVVAGIVARCERERIERERDVEKKTGWERSSSVHGRHE